MERKPMLLTQEEREWIEEIRAVRLGNPNTPIQLFTFVADQLAAERVGDVAQMALDVESTSLEGSLFAFAIKVAEDPSIRRDQYMVLLQLVQQRLGPRDDEDFQFYFDPKLQLS